MTYGEMTAVIAGAVCALPLRSASRSNVTGRPEARWLICRTCLPHSHRHHVMAELVLVEIVDDHGRPSPAGTRGRVVVTPFYNHAMPLIRYDIEDLAVPAVEPLRFAGAACRRSTRCLAARATSSVSPTARASPS